MGGGLTSQADRISGRQLEILRRLANGEKRDVIAVELGISVNTFDTYRNRLYRRLGAHTAAQALANFLRSRQPELSLF